VHASYQDIIPLPFNDLIYNLRYYNKRNNIDGSGRGVLYIVNGANKRKGFDILVNVINYCLKVNSNIYWSIVVGHVYDIKSFTKLKAMQRKHSQRIFILRSRPHEELPYIYMSSDILISTSRYELLGLSMIESLALGVPVVSTPTAGAKVIILNNVNGMIVNTFNPRKICKALLALVSDEERLRRLSLLAPHTVLRFKPREVSSKWTKVFDLIANY